MSHIPEKAMHHARAEPARIDLDEGKITPVDQGGASGSNVIAWVLGAAGAGVAVAAAAALFSLRSSTPAKPAPRRAPRKTIAKKPRAKTAAAKAAATAEKKPATRRRRAPAKSAAAASA